uniref:Chemosensory protein 17 n=1 Tax=Agrilus planipennis TaxID=224129 RepID=A0A890UXC5_AGRPL|nr:chemosensory protein 17 [Agrilus planipennis]
MVYKTHFLLVLLGLALAEAFPGEKNKYDNIDIDAICKNKRLLLGYVNCMLDKGPCTAEGRALKENIPNSLENKCSDCEEADKERVKKGATCVRCSYPEEWEAIVEHFDPEKKYREIGREFFGEKSC